MKRSSAAAAFVLSLLVARSAHAEPYRLRADAFVATLAPQPPVGVLILRGEDSATPWLDTEAVVWAGSPGPADALIVLARVHDTKNRTELVLGRQIITAGAIRPTHLDGARARVRAPSGTILEAFGGIPTTPRLEAKAFDWIAGGRIAQDLGKNSIVGLAYHQRRDAGRLDREEVGFDFASAAFTKFDIAGTAAWDLVHPGFSEAKASASFRFTDVRAELYATHRSPSRLLPATSLFSALGDIPSELVGTTVRARLAPRLDVMPTFAMRFAGDSSGPDLTVRFTLRLDDDGAGVLAMELRRQGTAPDRWMGARVIARVPFARRFHASTELEVVRPDESRGRGTFWPWGLLALGYRPWTNWETAAAVEASSTPQSRVALDALLRITRTWGTP